MARTTKRSFWSFITRRRGTSPRPAPTFTRLWRRLSLERLEGRALPSVSFGADPGNPGKSIVSFNDDTTDGVNLQLRLSNGQLQYRWGNSGNYSTDLNTATSGIDA